MQNLYQMLFFMIVINRFLANMLCRLQSVLRTIYPIWMRTAPSIWQKYKIIIQCTHNSLNITIHSEKKSALTEGRKFWFCYTHVHSPQTEARSRLWTSPEEEKKKKKKKKKKKIIIFATSHFFLVDKWILYIHVKLRSCVMRIGSEQHCDLHI